jgi:hypothetical protein
MADLTPHAAVKKNPENLKYASKELQVNNGALLKTK